MTVLRYHDRAPAYSAPISWPFGTQAFCDAHSELKKKKIAQCGNQFHKVINSLAIAPYTRALSGSVPYTRCEKAEREHCATAAVTTAIVRVRVAEHKTGLGEEG